MVIEPELSVSYNRNTQYSLSSGEEFAVQWVAMINSQKSREPLLSLSKEEKIRSATIPPFSAGRINFIISLTFSIVRVPPGQSMINSLNYSVISCSEQFVFVVRNSMFFSVSSGLDSLSLLFSNNAFHLRDDFMHEKTLDNPGGSSTLLEAIEK